MAGSLQTFRKDPDAILDYGFDWSDWLESGETITGSTWTVPTGISEGANSRNDTSVKVWLSGGTAGEAYVISCKITTSVSPRVDERSLTVMVEER